MKLTSLANMSNFRLFFDMSGVYVDLIDAFVTCVEKMAISNADRDLDTS
jgi:hypothetical protein